VIDPDGNVVSGLDDCVPLTLEALVEMVVEAWSDVAALAVRIRRLEAAQGLVPGDDG